MKAVILAGGKGTRLAPYTKVLPKPLMPIGEMPILEILLRQMHGAGIHDFVITVGHLAGLMQAFFQNGERLGVNIAYSVEDHPLGTAGPLSLITGLDKPFLVANGDVLTTLDLGELVSFHYKNQAVATIATHTRSIYVDLGVIQFNGTNEVIGYIEKPTYQYQVSMGIYVFEPRVLRYIEHNQYLDFPDLVLRLLAAGEKVVGYPFEGYWQDLGRQDDYEQAVLEFDGIRDQILGDAEAAASAFNRGTQQV